MQTELTRGKPCWRLVGSKFKPVVFVANYANSTPAFPAVRVRDAESKEWVLKPEEVTDEVGKLSLLQSRFKEKYSALIAACKTGAVSKAAAAREAGLKENVYSVFAKAKELGVSIEFNAKA